MRLAELQRAFQCRVLGRSPEIIAVIHETENFDATARLRVYEEAFVARLSEAMTTTFPALLSCMGGPAFSDLIRNYALSTPPTHFSIRHYGHDLGALIAAKSSRVRATGLAELAHWEWELGNAFDAADADPVSRDALSQIPPDQWPQVRFQLSASFRRAALHTNAVKWWRNAVQGDPAPSRWRTTKRVEWAIWRSNLTVYFRSLAADEACAVDAIARGKSFAQVCETLQHFTGSADAPSRAAELLLKWLHDGWIVGIELPSKEP